MKKKLFHNSLRYSLISVCIGSVLFSVKTFAGDLADLPYEAGNWTPPKVYILLDNSESMRAESVIPSDDDHQSLFPAPGVREGIVAQWDAIFFDRFRDPDSARLKFIKGELLAGVSTENTTGTSVANTQCNIIDPTKNTLYFSADKTLRPFGYMPWIWWNDTRYGTFGNASLSEIPSWFRFGACGNLNDKHRLPLSDLDFPDYATLSANKAWLDEYNLWKSSTLSQQEVANWWKYHSTRSKLVQGALSDAMDYLKRDIIFGIRELNGPAVDSMQLTLDPTQTSADNTSTSAVKLTATPEWIIPPSEKAVSFATNDLTVNIPAFDYMTGNGASEEFDQDLIEQRNVEIIKALLKRKDLDTVKINGDTKLKPKHNVGRTPLRSGLYDIGNYFKKDADALDNSCQRSFALVVTDGYWNEAFEPGASNPINSDQDGDTYEVTLADVAAYFYNEGFGGNNLVPNQWNAKTKQHLSTYILSMGLTGNLKGATSDCLGDWPTSVGALNPLPIPPTSAGMMANWGNPQADKVGFQHIGVADPERVDDMWHAAYNSYGRFINTNNAYTLANRLFYSLKNMYAQSQSFEDKNIVSGIELNMESRPKKLYVSSFNPSNWTGSLKAYNLKDDGSIDNQAFANVSGFAEAGGGKDNVFTFNTTTKTPTKLSSYHSLGNKEKSDLYLSEVLRTYSTTSASCRPAMDMEKLVDFLKGDKSYEGVPPHNFRKRESSIADVVHSKPVFVGKPSKYYKDRWQNQSARENSMRYSEFRSAQANRTKALYVGANDGYLHAFDAENGQRIFSYMPSFLIKDIGLLADAVYTHQYFMDGQMAIDDVCIPSSVSVAGCAWKTILVGAAGAGGQGVFALDITDPSAVNAGHVLWEFTDINNNSTGTTSPYEPDLGYVMGVPNIGRFRNLDSSSGKDTGQWLVVFSGGYHNTSDNLMPKGFRNPFYVGYEDPSSTKSATGEAYLYLLNVADGKIVKKIGVPGGTRQQPNGLGSPALIDANGDDIVDYIYVGDLLGRLWKIDVRNGDPKDWSSLSTTNFSGTTVNLSNSDALFEAPNGQPITTMPIAVFHPNHLFEEKRDADGKIIRGTTTAPDSHKLLLYFGTGKFFEKGDSLPQSQPNAQAFYAIYDEGINKKLTSNDLKKRTKNTDYLVNAVDGINNGDRDFIMGLASSYSGWYLELADNGERIVADATYRAVKDVNGNNILNETKVFFNIMVPSAGGNCRVANANTVDGFTMILDPFTGNNAHYDGSSMKGGIRISRSAGFSNLRTQGFNGGYDRLFVEETSADGATQTMSSVSVGSAARYHRESFLQLTQ